MIDKHLSIINELKVLKSITPSNLKVLLENNDNAISEINKAINKDLFYSSNEYFNECGTYLLNLEEGIKVNKENIRGI